MPNANVLSERYATPEMNYIFSDEGKIRAERSLWIAVMKAQRELGMNIPYGDIEKFKAAIGEINLGRIKEIERITKHDVKAKIQDFVNVSGAGEYLHLGMTSRDLTDNVEQMQIRDASKIIFGKNVSVLRHMIEKADKYSDAVFTARTHNVPAQSTFLGRRFSMWAEELMEHLEPFEKFVENYPLRGMKGAVGTQSDMLALLGSAEKVEALEKKVAEHLEFKRTLSSTGQVYPRSLDFAFLNNLVALASAQENFAKNIRIMAGYDLVTEGFEEGQTGSSAMPHKMNTRSSERINGFGVLLKGYQDMISRLSGDQWGEGDVSCSVVRRIAIPDSFYAADGQLETTLTVLNNMKVYEGTIRRELEYNLPFLATTRILTVAMKNGIGREQAHKLIKKYSTRALLMRREMGNATDFMEELAADPLFVEKGITHDALKKAVLNIEDLLGNARGQIKVVSNQAKDYIGRYKQEAAYEPKLIL